MDEHLAVVRDLMDRRIAFSVHYPTKTSWVVTITDKLNNEQLKIVVYLGGSMGPQDALYILGNFDNDN